MGKKNRNSKLVQPVVGVSLGFKHLGKPISLAFAVYDTDVIEPVFKSNSEEFTFTGLPVAPELFVVWDDETQEALTTVGSGKSLGLMFITDSGLVSEVDGVVTVPGETLPFKLGENRFWRNPKYGTLLAEDDDEPNVLARKELSGLFSERFSGFDGIYTIEQVVDAAGVSDSLDLVLLKRVLSIVS